MDCQYIAVARALTIRAADSGHTTEASTASTDVPIEPDRRTRPESGSAQWFIAAEMAGSYGVAEEMEFSIKMAEDSSADDSLVQQDTRAGEPFASAV